jgi:hypothetical protein
VSAESLSVRIEYRLTQVFVKNSLILILADGSARQRSCRHELCSNDEKQRRGTPDGVSLPLLCLVETIGGGKRRRRWSLLDSSVRTENSEKPLFCLLSSNSQVHNLRRKSPRKCQRTRIGCPRRKKGGLVAAVNRAEAFRCSSRSYVFRNDERRRFLIRSINRSRIRGKLQGDSFTGYLMKRSYK